MPPVAATATAIGRLMSPDCDTWSSILNQRTEPNPGRIIDLYLPALPAMAQALDASAAQMQWTLAGTTVGFAAGQAVVGPLSDRHGRRRPLLASITLHLFASALVAASPTITLLLLGRVLQGFGAAAGVVVALAIARDLYGGPPLVVLLSKLALVTGLAPIIAPVVGAQIQQLSGWRAIFAVLTGFSLIVLVALAATVPETSRLRFPDGHAVVLTYRARYIAVFRDRRFWGAALIGGMNFTALFAYLASSPFLVQTVFGFAPAQFGLVFAANSVGVVIGIQSAARLAQRIDPQRILLVALPLMAAALVSILVWGHNDNPAFVLGSVFLYITFGGLCVPCVQLIALRDHARQSGTAASVLGILNYGLAGLLSPILGLFPITSAAPMSAYMLTATCVSIGALMYLLRPWQPAQRQ
ncbi:multidrug effflux MFS transporter [Agromyces sp. GXQ0307]|uniref:multidrug effflux MFS transporter n=1 Tax=Agromyces sp. GXQ0307 TaxID=3377835 RepID=UPI003839FF54